MEQSSEVGKHRESAFTSANGVGDLPSNISSSEGSDQSDRGDTQRNRHGGFRRNPNHPHRPPQGPHRRYKSLPGGGFSPAAPPPYQPGSARAAGPMDGAFHPPQIPVYHPWVSGYDVQWSAYGMYVHSTVMSQRSDKATRIVFIGNLSPSVKEKHVFEAASKFGPLRGVDASLREYWFGMFVSYWDTRHAERAVRGLPEMLPGVGSDDTQKIPCNTFYMIPPSAVGMENQGLLTVKIGENVTSTMIRNLFSKFGDVKSVRTVSEQSKAVEFYDARAAEAAIAEIKSSAEHHAIVHDVEIAPVTPPPEQTNNNIHAYAGAGGKTDENGSTDGGDIAQSSSWPAPNTPYHNAWGPYTMPLQPYRGDVPPLQRQHSAPAAGYTDHHRPNVYSMRRPDALWSGHYMGYAPPPPPPHCMRPSSDPSFVD